MKKLEKKKIYFVRFISNTIKDNQIILNFDLFKTVENIVSYSFKIVSTVIYLQSTFSINIFKNVFIVSNRFYSLSVYIACYMSRHITVCE